MGRAPATAGDEHDHLSRGQGSRQGREALLFCRLAAPVSGCQHEEYGESPGSTTRTPHRRPAPAPGAHGGPAGQASAWSHARARRTAISKGHHESDILLSGFQDDRGAPARAVAPEAHEAVDRSRRGRHGEPDAHAHVRIRLRRASRQGLRLHRRLDPRRVPRAATRAAAWRARCCARTTRSCSPARSRSKAAVDHEAIARAGDPRDRLRADGEAVPRRPRAGLQLHLEAVGQHRPGRGRGPRARQGAGRRRPGHDVRLRHRRDAGADAAADPPRAPPDARARRRPPQREVPVAAPRRQVAGVGRVRERHARRA